MITQGELRNLIEYNSETGLWRWRSPRGSMKAGWFAGYSNSRGYLYIKVDGREYASHTLAWFYMYGDWFLDLDHINRNKADNRISNLRMSSRSTNTFNAGLRSDNASGHTGIYWLGNNRRKAWRASIKKEGFVRQKTFATKEEAIAWRTKLAEELFGQFVPKVVPLDRK